VEELFKKSGHQAAVLRVQWADPEFGSVIASASYDKIVHIWEEVEVKDKKEWQRKNMF
jgi:WD40 repeat protein